MSLVSQWPPVGVIAKEEAFKYLDAFFDAGGNFIDVASYYQGGDSELWIGEWLEVRGIRDQVVVATKYTGTYAGRQAKNIAATVGNSARLMRVSVDASLKKLRTMYIDIFYVHWWDYTTSVAEMMDALNNLVVQGKVIYLGASNFPAFRLAQCNQYARDHGKTLFSIFQGEWNVVTRGVERELLPLCQADGMAFAPWNLFFQGKLRTDAEEAEREKKGALGRTNFTAEWKRNDQEKAASAAPEKVSKAVGVSDICAVALAYHFQRFPHVFPILGGNKIEQLHSNLKSLTICLSDTQMVEIEAAAPFDPGYPNVRIGKPHEPSSQLLPFVPY